jgi:hypothetical protein
MKHFEITLRDGSVLNENWSEISDKKLVKYGDSNKVVYLCNKDAKSITITSNDLSTTVDIPGGQGVYFAKKGQTIFLAGGNKNQSFIGLVVGLVKDGVVIEERFINNQTKEIVGFKK